MAWPTTSRHERGYGAAHVRMRNHLLNTVVFCEECTRQGRTTLGRIADHKVPKAKGGTDDRSNYQLLCDPCSDAKTLAEKGHDPDAVKAGVDVSGRPTDPNHPWNRSAGARRG